MSRLANRPDRVVVSKDLTVYSSNTGRCCLNYAYQETTQFIPDFLRRQRRVYWSMGEETLLRAWSRTGLTHDRLLRDLISGTMQIKNLI
ncbi:MAG: hypothetical protein WB696_30810 [Chthoniobacterales bacterium]